MSLTAETLMPLFSALPEQEKHAFAEKVHRLMNQKRKPARKKKDIYDKIGDKFRPENREILVAEIMNGQL